MREGGKEEEEEDSNAQSVDVVTRKVLNILSNL